jgi:hypothetical protein
MEEELFGLVVDVFPRGLVVVQMYSSFFVKSRAKQDEVAGDQIARRVVRQE